MANQAGWRIDVNQCVSCRACEMACKAEYGLQAGQGRRRRVIERTKIESGVTRTYFISISCHHCERPACKEACPMSKKLDSVTGAVRAGDTPYTSALYKDSHTTNTYTSSATQGVVLHNPSRCIGCRRCEWACPYGAPQYNPQTRKVHKCELCWQRVANDALSSERKVPACAATCLGGSIVFCPANGTGAEPEWGFTGALTAGTADSTGASFYTPTAINPQTARGAQWARPGEVGSDTGYLQGRGSSESESYTLTFPAIRIRPRVYQNKNRSAVE